MGKCNILKHKTVHVPWDKALMPHIFLSRMVEQDVNLSEEFCWLLEGKTNSSEYTQGQNFVIAVLDFPSDFGSSFSVDKVHSFPEFMHQFSYWGVDCLSLPHILQVLQVYRPKNEKLIIPSFGDIVITYTEEHGKYIEVLSVRNIVGLFSKRKFIAAVPF